jgi:hypothetical protein
MTAHDWDAIERAYRAGQLSIKELARQHKFSDSAKAKGWTRDLSDAVRTRVRESLVCESRKPDRREQTFRRGHHR